MGSTTCCRIWSVFQISLAILDASSGMETSSDYPCRVATTATFSFARRTNYLRQYASKPCFSSYLRASHVRLEFRSSYWLLSLGGTHLGCKATVSFLDAFGLFCLVLALEGNVDVLLSFTTHFIIVSSGAMVDHSPQSRTSVRSPRGVSLVMSRAM